MCRPEALDSVLLHALRNMDKSQLAALPDCSEGLENRLYIACRKATDRVQLLEMLKTKRYPHARLSRLCTHGMLGITQALQKKNPMPTYASLLGFRKESEGLLALLNQSDLSVIAKASHGPLEEAAYQLDARAYDLWALGAGQPTGLMFTQPVQIIP